MWCKIKCLSRFCSLVKTTSCVFSVKILRSCLFAKLSFRSLFSFSLRGMLAMPFSLYHSLCSRMMIGWNWRFLFPAARRFSALCHPSMSFIGADFFFKNTPAGWWPSWSFNPSFGNILDKTLKSGGCVRFFQLVEHWGNFSCWEKWQSH